MKILDKVDEKLKQYKSEHNGDTPMYIQVSTFESEDLRKAIRSKEGLQNEPAITTYQGSKVVENLALKKGDLFLSDELPESGS
jgi:hypothetical protein